MTQRKSMILQEYFATAKLCATQAFDGNFVFVLAGYAVRLVRLVVIAAVFHSLPDSNSMSLSQALTYAVLSSAFTDQLYIFTPATTALWEGSIIGRFTRPVPVIGTLIAETVGKWVPSLLFYTVPVLVFAPFLGIRLLPSGAGNGVLFVLSLLLAISLGFAVDLIFAGVSMRLKNGCFAALHIREAVTALFSGALIPFALLPKSFANVLELLPFGSLAGAPLAIFVGTGDAIRLLTLSLFWNAILWPVCILFFHKSQEKMISFGG